MKSVGQFKDVTTLSNMAFFTALLSNRERNISKTLHAKFVKNDISGETSLIIHHQLRKCFRILIRMITENHFLTEFLKLINILAYCFPQNPDKESPISSLQRSFRVKFNSVLSFALCSHCFLQRLRLVGTVKRQRIA